MKPERSLNFLCPCEFNDRLLTATSEDSESAAEKQCGEVEQNPHGASILHDAPVRYESDSGLRSGVSFAVWRTGGRSGKRSVISPRTDIENAQGGSEALDS